MGNDCWVAALPGAHAWPQSFCVKQEEARQSAQCTYSTAQDSAVNTCPCLPGPLRCRCVLCEEITKELNNKYECTKM